MKSWHEIFKKIENVFRANFYISWPLEAKI